MLGKRKTCIKNYNQNWEWFVYSCAIRINEGHQLMKLMENNGYGRYFVFTVYMYDAIVIIIVLYTLGYTQYKGKNSPSLRLQCLSVTIPHLMNRDSKIVEFFTDDVTFIHIFIE